MTRIKDRLDALGIVLPGPYPPHEPLDAVVCHGGRARTSGQLPRDREGNLVHPGVVGDAGRHSRSAVGVAALPRGGAVEIEVEVALRD